MAIDHRGHLLAVNNVVQILPVKLFKTQLGWYRKIARMRKHCRSGIVLTISGNGDLTLRGVDGNIHLIPSRYVSKVL